MRLNKLPEYLRMMPWLASKSRWIVIAVTSSFAVSGTVVSGP
jgi:hypothetical protein